MSEVAQTTKEVIEVVTTALQPLADKLGTTAQYVWGLQVKQAYVEGFIALGGLMFGIFLCGLSVWLVKHLTNERGYDIVDVFIIIFLFFIIGFKIKLLPFKGNISSFFGLNVLESKEYLISQPALLPILTLKNRFPLISTLVAFKQS